MAVLSGHALACSKRDRLLFEGIELSVSPSQLLHIKGPNGAGKTSLLRILVGLSEPEQGFVAFNSHPISKVAEDYHQQLVYFGHKLGLNLHFNPLENLHHWAQQHGVNVSDEHIIEVLDDLGLVGLETLPVGSLSAGQQRRVALARLWLKRGAKIWILDEPFTALDVEGIATLKHHLVAHLGQGGSVIMTSHQNLDIPYPVTEVALEYRI